MSERNLSQLQPGEQAAVLRVNGVDFHRQRLLEHGVLPGRTVTLIRRAPWGDPLEIDLLDYRLSVRMQDAQRIIVDKNAPAREDHISLRGNSKRGRAAHLSVSTPRAETSLKDRVLPHRVLLAGNPNTGKTTLFNRLTGASAKVGNYPGVTVDHHSGEMKLPRGDRVEVIDLPGTYSLNARTKDEQLAVRLLIGNLDHPPDAAVVVLSATALARSLYLAVQLWEFGIPTMCVVNMIDEAARRGIEIDIERLKAQIPLIWTATDARKGIGIDALRHDLQKLVSRSQSQSTMCSVDLATGYLEHVNPVCQIIARDERIAVQSRQAFAFWCLSSGQLPDLGLPFDAENQACIADVRSSMNDLNLDIDLALAEARFDFIETHTHQAISVSARKRITDAVDAVLTHPVSGSAAFLAVLVIIFTALFDWAAPLMTGIEWCFSSLSSVVRQLIPYALARELVADGVIAGAGSVVVFLPQIGILFVLLGLLQASGYMARAAFMMDRLMRAIGLHGKAFVPMMSGYACAIPAVMATRTMERQRDRLLTMMVIPLISCSARLPIYTLIISTLFPAQQRLWGPVSLGAAMMMALYLLSTALALVAAAVLSRTVLKGQRSSFIIELPPYRLPSWRTLCLEVWQKVKLFLKTAGTIIVVMSVVLWALLSFPTVSKVSGQDDPQQALNGHQRESVLRSERLKHSYAGRIGRFIEPLIEPLGFDWKIGIGLIGSFAAREVFVATMGLVYGIEEADETSTSLHRAMQRAKRRDGTALYTPLTGLSLLVFFMIAMQCLSTVAVIRQESKSWKWPLFLVVSLTGTAYIAALSVYQLGRALGYH